MAKWYGVIGYAETTETAPGVWSETVTERPYYGDLLRNYKRDEPSGQLNDELKVDNELSVVCDPYAMANFHAIRYASYLGTRWKVTSVEVRFPRLDMKFGGVYNGPTP